MRGSLAGAATAGLIAFQPAMAAPALRLPPGAMLLSRRIERPLSDGHAITVARTWETRFARSGRGIQVEGRQIAVKVDAPEALKPLARIEQQRETDTMFPLLLTSDGTIVGTGPSQEGKAIDEALRIAEAMIARSAKSQSEKKSAIHHLASLQVAGNSLLEILPRDLFFPASQPQRSVRRVALPDGSSGEIEMEYVADRMPGAPWLASSTRSVITRLGGSERISREIWTLSEAG